MHTTIDDTIVPGPILANGTFLYQQDDTPGRNACNLWGGSLQAHNGNEPRHVEKAVKLFLAAPDLLAVVNKFVDAATNSTSTLDFSQRCDAFIEEARAAIAKAEPT